MWYSEHLMDDPAGATCAVIIPTSRRRRAWVSLHFIPGLMALELFAHTVYTYIHIC